MLSLWQPHLKETVEENCSVSKFYLNPLLRVAEETSVTQETACASLPSEIMGAKLSANMPV